jgi:hypothetical protein
MTTNRPANPSEPNSERRELARLIRRIQTLGLELQEPRRGELHAPEVDAKQRMLEQLRWRLAAVARRAVHIGYALIVAPACSDTPEAGSPARSRPSTPCLCCS